MLVGIFNDRLALFWTHLFSNYFTTTIVGSVFENNLTAAIIFMSLYSSHNKIVNSYLE